MMNREQVEAMAEYLHLKQAIKAAIAEIEDAKLDNNTKSGKYAYGQALKILQAYVGDLLD